MNVQIGTKQFDAFTTVADADDYLAGDVARAASWADLSADAKGRALVSATRMLLTLPWCDATPDPTVDQASPIPEVTAMLGADLAAKPALFADASGNSNVKVAKAGSAQVEFFAPVEGGPPIPRALWDMLSRADLVCLNGTSDLSALLDGVQAFGISDGCRPLGGRYPWDWPIASEDYD